MSYTIPDGTTLAEILALQFSGTPGIATRENEIMEWPESLGSRPSQANINTWAASIAAARQTARRAKVKAKLRDNDEERQVLRSVVRVLMASLVEARTTINDLRAAMVNATSLADLKTRATAVSALTNRTWAQALTAAEQVIDAGQAEE